MVNIGQTWFKETDFILVVVYMSNAKEISSFYKTLQQDLDKIDPKWVFLCFFGILCKPFLL